jgi:hypothetical protein
MNLEVEQLLQQIEQIRSSDMPGNIKASKIYSVRCQLKRLGWSDEAPTSSQTWCCPSCGNKIVTHIPVLEVACSRHSTTQAMKHN